MEIGEHCSQSSCQRLDFLPFTCEQCQRLFCSDHRFPEQHGCDHKPPSPSHRCQGHHEARNELRSFVCSVPDCKRKEMMEVNCPHCERIFCLQHRHQVDHDCPELVKQPPKTSKASHKLGGAATAETSAAKTWSPAKASRLESTRNKVLLMKLKMKAEGSDAVPLSERVYYNVQLPAVEVGPGQLPSSKPMFFSREWSVGKVVDSIAQKYKLKNENNRLHSGHKLVLHNVDGEAVEMSRPLKSFLDSGLPNGGSLVLKYVPH